MLKKNAIPVEEYNHLLIETDDYSLFQLKVDKLQRVMEIISVEGKIILLLKYQDDLSIKDLSNVLHIGESAVMTSFKSKEK